MPATAPLDRTVLRLLIQAHLARAHADGITGSDWLADSLRRGYEDKAARCELAAEVHRQNKQPGMLLRGWPGS